MKVFSIDGYFVDEPEQPFTGYLVAELDGTPEGYHDDQIFFYGLSEQDIIQAIKEGDTNGEDFVITNYEVME